MIFFACVPKGIVFFFSWNSLILAHFGQKSTEWVKIVFFFHFFFYFSGLLKLSEWVGCKLFPHRKKNVGKKKNNQNVKKLQNISVFDLVFVNYPLLRRVSGCKLFLGKKKQFVFFFPESGKKKNKILENRVSEWR